MSLKDKAVLIFKPSRVGSGKAYSFRGEDFTFSRSGIATRINESGNIEEVANGIPRLNYDPTDLTKCPHLLLEDSRTNYVTNSTSLGWKNYQASVKSNVAISPDGTQNAHKLVNDSGNSYHFINFSHSGTTRTLSVFVKPDEYYVAGISSRSTNPFAITYDLLSNTSTITYDQNSVVSNHGIIKHANGWYRIWACVSTMVQMNIHCAPYGYSGSFQNNDADGDGVSGIYIWQPQIEDGLIPTSIIKTTGATASRGLEAMQITTLSNMFKQVKGTFMIDLSAVDDTATDSIRIRSSASNYGRAYFYENRFGFADSWGSEVITSASPIPNSKKTKFIWRLDDNSNGTFFLNGKQSNSVSTSTQAWNDIAYIYFRPQGGTMMINEMYFSADALSSSECIALTSYDDYQELVDRNELTWESPTITNNRLTALQEL